MNVAPSKPRNCGIHFHRENVPADTIAEYYRRTVTLPSLDEIISDLEIRFNPENMHVIKGFYCIPSIMQKYPAEWKSNVLEFMHEHRKDMINLQSCEAELDHWETLWCKRDRLNYPDSVKITISSMMTGMFPNIHRVLILHGVTAITTCLCEHSISVQRRLKTYLRSTMVQDAFFYSQSKNGMYIFCIATS